MLTSTYERATKDRFVWWLKTKLLPKLRRGDIMVMDNLAARSQRMRVHGVEVVYLPPYSPAFNPIESAWALQKQRSSPRSALEGRASQNRSTRAPSSYPAALPQLVLTLRLPRSNQLIPGVSCRDVTGGAQRART